MILLKMMVLIDGFIEEKKGDKYLNITGMQLTIVLKKMNDGELGEYDKDYMKIKFYSDDDITLNKQMYLPTITVIIRNIIEKDGKYYVQIFLYQCLYEV